MSSSIIGKIWVTIVLCGLVSCLNLEDLKYYEEVRPVEVKSNEPGAGQHDQPVKKDSPKHQEEKRFRVNGYGKTFDVFLYKNRAFLPETFLTLSQKDLNGGSSHEEKEWGSYIADDYVENCHYHGYLLNEKRSSVVASTCAGLNAIIKDEDDEEFVLQKYSKTDDFEQNNNSPEPKYIMYKKKDIKTKRKEGQAMKDVKQEEKKLFGERMDFENVQWALQSETPNAHDQTRNGNLDTKFIELVLVVDFEEFNWYKISRGSHALGIAATKDRVLGAINIVDSYYKWLNTRVILSKLIIWDKSNLVPITSSPGDTLSQLEKFTKEKMIGEMKLHADHFHFVAYRYWELVSGLAKIGTMCWASSVAITLDVSSHWLLANVISHEIGHSIGFYHRKCSCQKPPCLMNENLPGYSAQSFAECTRERYNKLLRTGQLPCLLNYPKTFYLAPRCGNGLLEKGEECDCGSRSECSDLNVLSCCNPETCTLHDGAECAKGVCCDSCKFKQRGETCREKIHPDCDLEEYCTGKSEHCPDNFYVGDGAQCHNASSYCFEGGCRTHDDQCESLWGPMVKKADDTCFQENVIKKASVWTNCGKDKSTGKFVKCAPKDAFCGKVQCVPKSPGDKISKPPQIGAFPKALRTFKIRSNYGTTICVQGTVTALPDMRDPTLTDSGIKCGVDSICMNGECVHLSTLAKKKCDRPCMNGGVCNNNGHCHCTKGFACPYCETPGEGGSVDSGRERVNG